jgi:hypothetical protein
MEVAMVSDARTIFSTSTSGGSALFIFLPPWLFALPYGPARFKPFSSGAIVVLLSSAAPADGEQV